MKLKENLDANYSKINKVKMKYLMIILLSFQLVGCSTINGVKVKKYGNSCFSREDLKKLIVQKNIETTNLFIKPIAIKEKKCIGLYGYTAKNLTVTSIIVEKALKFENKIYYYSDENKKANESALEEFKNKYGEYFKPEEIDKLTDSFKKGTEIITRLY